MDFSKLIARVKAILTTPRTEWPVIGGEAGTVKDLYSGYFIWLAAIPPICDFIRSSIIGRSVFGMTYRAGIGSGIAQMVAMYVLTLVMLYVVALIVNALAGTFEGQKNQVQALKAVGYSYTAVWVAGIGHLIPWLGTLILIAGGVYGIYLLYLGLPHTMKCPPEKAAGYTVVTVIATLVLGWILAMIVGGMFATSHLGSSISMSGSDGSTVTIDKDSALGKLDAMSKRMEAASKQMEAAQKSGDSAATSQALGAMMGAMAGSNGAIESLAPDQLKAFLPDRVDGMKRASISAQRQSAMGMQMSEAEASYASDDGSRHVTIKLGDTGGAKGLLSLAGAFGMESDKETPQGFDKTWREDGRILHAKWNKDSRSGEYGIVLGDRFTVEAHGNGSDIDSLKDALGDIDLAKLESLKNQGVQQD